MTSFRTMTDGSISSDRVSLHLVEFLNAGENRAGCKAYWTRLRGADGRFVLYRWLHGSTISTHSFRLSSSGGSVMAESGDGTAAEPEMANQSASGISALSSPIQNRFSHFLGEAAKETTSALADAESARRESRALEKKMALLLEELRATARRADAAEEAFHRERAEKAGLKDALKKVRESIAVQAETSRIVRESLSRQISVINKAIE